MSLLFTTDLDGTIQAIIPGEWDDFAFENGAPELLDHSRLVGRSLLEFISGRPTRTAVSAILQQLRTGARDEVSYLYSCDSPETARAMRLTIRRSPDRKILEFFSKTLSERPRLVQVLMGQDGNRSRLDWPIRTICSVCKQIQSPRDSGQWLDLDAYESNGGDTAVRISHGLCEPCLSSMMA